MHIVAETVPLFKKGQLIFFGRGATYLPEMARLEVKQLLESRVGYLSAVSPTDEILLSQIESTIKI